MIWSFVYESLSTQKFGSKLQIISVEDKKCVFQLKVVNQRKFKSKAALNASWQVLLEFGKRKGLPLPKSTTEYTALRSRFVNGLLRCSCGGKIRKIGGAEATKLKLTNKNFMYFEYIGKSVPVRNEDYSDTDDSEDVLYNSSEDVSYNSGEDVSNIAIEDESINMRQINFTTPLGICEVLENGSLRLLKFLTERDRKYLQSGFSNEPRHTQQLQTDPFISSVNVNTDSPSLEYSDFGNANDWEAYLPENIINW